jgi:chromosomal replication initiation ATPase DnaA
METYLQLNTDHTSSRINSVELEINRAKALKSLIERKYKVNICNRTKIFVDYKQIFMFLCTKYTALSQQQIADMLCLKSHTSISLACKKVNEICSVNKRMVALVKEIETEWQKLLEK